MDAESQETHVIGWAQPAFKVQDVVEEDVKTSARRDVGIQLSN